MLLIVDKSIPSHLLLIMYSLHETLDNLWFTRVFTFIFRYLAGVIIVWPQLCYLNCYELNNDVHRLNMWEVIGEVSAYSE